VPTQSAEVITSRIPHPCSPCCTAFDTTLRPGWSRRVGHLTLILSVAHLELSGQLSLPPIDTISSNGPPPLLEASSSVFTDLLSLTIPPAVLACRLCENYPSVIFLFQPGHLPSIQPLDGRARDHQVWCTLQSFITTS
jgi:hypothetical protein